MTISELRAQCLQCDKCELSAVRTKVVFGTGDEHARIMLVGEAPGKNEDETGEPFAGRAGDLLNSYLAAVGLHREDVYIANILKCRPPQNRDPLPEEQDMCIDWLREQFKLVSPKIILCLGRISARRLIGEDFLVTRDHGRIFKKHEVLMMGTFHPAALLRNPNNKSLVLDDFQKLAQCAQEE
ncbi:MAG: uracil-DNA glycosylase [Oscillospiraceae bacterium]